MKRNPQTGAILASEMLRSIEWIEANNGRAVAGFKADLAAVDRALLKPPNRKESRRAKTESR